MLQVRKHRINDVLLYCMLPLKLWSSFSPERHRLGDSWKKGKDPHPQDKIQHLDFTKDPRPLYYRTPPCVFYHKNVRSKAVFGP